MVSPTVPAATQESFAVARRVLTGMIGIVDGIIGGALGHPAAPPALAGAFASGQGPNVCSQLCFRHWGLAATRWLAYLKNLAFKAEIASASVDPS